MSEGCGSHRAVTLWQEVSNWHCYCIDVQNISRTSTTTVFHSRSNCKSPMGRHQGHTQLFAHFTSNCNHWTHFFQQNHLNRSWVAVRQHHYQVMKLDKKS